MKRDKKFRAFDKATSRMLAEGFHILGEVTCFDLVTQELMDQPLGKTTLERIGDVVISEFTGKQDINEADLYEDDIVEGTCSENPRYVCEGLRLTNSMGKRLHGVIRYSDLYAQFYFTTDDITYLDLAFGLQDIVKLGNVHQHPEFLSI